VARRTKRSSNGTDGIFEPNMTPLIDVSLVLVVILMVATPMAFQSGITVNAATATGRAAQAKPEVERVELIVRANGMVAVNNAEVPRDKLGPALNLLLKSGGDPLVVVRCEDEVAHGQFVSVLDEAKALGASRLAVGGD